MHRRALLPSTALLLTTTGCLAAARRYAAGPIHVSHAAVRVHDARQSFVHGGLGGSGSPERTGRGRGSYAAWFFTQPPSSDIDVFTDALGTETQRQWNGEIHDEDYEAGFVVLAQIRTPREQATTLQPMPLLCDPQWTGWRRARVPLGLERLERPPDDLAGAEQVVATLVGYVESSETPQRVAVPFLSSSADSCDAANETLVASSWSST